MCSTGDSRRNFFSGTATNTRCDNTPFFFGSVQLGTEPFFSFTSGDVKASATKDQNSVRCLDPPCSLQLLRFGVSDDLQQSVAEKPNARSKLISFCSSVLQRA
ncbi:hypothetical protein MRB53_023106 [Persea americana]|uniref:Uncharacterized protein n=1 Tax=Persea americana TaxID=3435 RepID=A0ACC2L908_PERAE|nr:hypothetical protein MRB53_023106 [Persea americana]